MEKRKRWSIAEFGPRPVDVYVGSRVRLRRTMLGMSQEQLGAAVHLTFQQIQKYERGTNRISASRLYEFSRVLDVPVPFFFDDMPPHVGDERSGRPGGTAQAQGAANEADMLAKREALEFVRAYYGISNAKVRKSIFELTKACAKAG